jgi:hypothetical protein
MAAFATIPLDAALVWFPAIATIASSVSTPAAISTNPDNRRCPSFMVHPRGMRKPTKNAGSVGRDQAQRPTTTMDLVNSMCGSSAAPGAVAWLVLALVEGAVSAYSRFACYHRTPNVIGRYDALLEQASSWHGPPGTTAPCARTSGPQT